MLMKESGAMSFLKDIQIFKDYLYTHATLKELISHPSSPCLPYSDYTCTITYEVNAKIRVDGNW